jgi:OTT_1508-like deaminase
MIENFRIRHAIQKMTSPQKYLNILFSFAHSPRLRPAFVSKLHIQTVPPDPVTFSLPKSAEEWEQLIRSICTSKDITAKRVEWFKEQGEEFSKLGDEVKGFVHCECNLIAFLLKEPNNIWPPPFSHIGVSKLSCVACYHWVQLFNKFFRRKYQTRGTHFKWYKGWAMPIIPDLQKRSLLEKKFVEGGVMLYCGYQKSEGNLQRLSDSTVASGEEEYRPDVHYEDDAADWERFIMEVT